MIRVLHVLASINVAAGMTNVVMNYYRNIGSKNVVFDFLFFDNSSDTTFEREIKERGGSCFFIDRNKGGFLKEIKLFIKNNAKKYNAIHCHPAYSWFICTFYAKKYGIKTRVVHSHSVKYSNKILSTIRNFISSLLCAFTANIFIAVNYESKRLLPFSKRKKAVVLNNGIDTKHFAFDLKSRRKIRDELGLSEDKKVIIHVGRFSKEKNHHFIINIFQEISHKNEDFYLVFVGDGILLQEIKQKVCDYSLDEKVLFVGRKNNVNDYLSASDAFVLPSLYEGAPVSLIEAQASGLTCFVSNKIPSSNLIINTMALSLKKDCGYWANFIIKKVQLKNSKNDVIKRLESCDIVSKAGFDVKINSSVLNNLYLK